MKLKAKIIILAIIAVFNLSGAFSAWGQGSNSFDDEINSLNQKIQAQKKQLDELQNRQKAYAQALQQKAREKASLQNQLDILDGAINKVQLDINGVSLEVDRNNLETKKIQLGLENTNQNIEEEKKHMASLLRLMYKQDEASTLEILLLNKSLTDFLNQMKYLENTNEEIANSLDNLKANKLEMEKQELALTEKKKELESLQSNLQEKNAKLEGEQSNKEFILDETRSSEKAYQALLLKAKREQQQAENEVAGLEKIVREKLAKNERQKLDNSDSTIYWPVPKNYISTTFHDPDYPFRNILGEHPGLDIRAAQGTSLRAAAAGYVARVKFDGSKAYAYIMIIHNDGLSTVYGHVSAVYVSPDEYVEKGQVIGRSGGKPGGVGTGSFSTGPHLHFEVRKNGIPVDPLEYMN